MKKKLILKKETLTELSPENLQAIVGGGESQSCPITYKCVNVSENGCNSIGCTATALINLPGGC